MESNPLPSFSARLKRDLPDNSSGLIESKQLKKQSLEVSLPSHLIFTHQFQKSFLHPAPVTHVLSHNKTIISASRDGSIFFWSRKPHPSPSIMTEYRENPPKKNSLKTPPDALFDFIKSIRGSNQPFCLFQIYSNLLFCLTIRGHLSLIDIGTCDILAEFDFFGKDSYCLSGTLINPTQNTIFCVTSTVSSAKDTSLYCIDCSQYIRFCNTDDESPKWKKCTFKPEHPMFYIQSLGDDRSTILAISKSQVSFLRISFPTLSVDQVVISNTPFSDSLLPISCQLNHKKSRCVIVTQDLQIFLFKIKKFKLLRKIPAPVKTIGDDEISQQFEFQLSLILAHLDSFISSLYSFKISKFLEKETFFHLPHVFFDQTDSFLLVPWNPTIKYFSLRNGSWLSNDIGSQVSLNLVGGMYIQCICPQFKNELVECPPLLIANSPFIDNQLFLFSDREPESLFITDYAQAKPTVVPVFLSHWFLKKQQKLDFNVISKDSFATQTPPNILLYFVRKYVNQKATHLTPEYLGSLGIYIHTTKGDIQIGLYPEPRQALANILALCETGYYDHVRFHRVMKRFMIQTGDPLGTGNGGESIWKVPFKTEAFPHLKHEQFTVSMANRGNKDPISNSSQFFITTTTTDWLDGKHTVFGFVEKGQNVVTAIENAPVYSTYQPKEAIEILSTTIFGKK